MSNLIGKSGTGIGKSGTGIGKSGTGIGKRGARRAWPGLCGIALAGVFGLSPLLASANSLQVSEHEGVLTVSLHDRGELVAGRISLEAAQAGYLTVPLARVNLDAGGFDPFAPTSHGSGSGTASHGSGSGEKSHGSGSGTSSHGSGSGTTSHGSGSGTTSHGSGSGTTSHGSGSGTTSHGSGSASHGSGTARPATGPVAGPPVMVRAAHEPDRVAGQSWIRQRHSEPRVGQRDGSGTTSHGSGSGQPEQAGCGTFALQSHGSGSGAAGNGCAFGSWGVAEIVIDSSGVNVIVHKLAEHGMTEHLLAFGPALMREQSPSVTHLRVVTP